MHYIRHHISIMIQIVIKLVDCLPRSNCFSLHGQQIYFSLKILIFYSLNVKVMIYWIDLN
jgi:hypothetical protein